MYTVLYIAHVHVHQAEAGAGGGAGRGWRLPTAEQALGASGYSHKHNMNIFQCSKHFDLFIENMRAWHQRERDDSTIYIYSICVCLCWHAAPLIDNRHGASSSTHGFAVINHFYRLLMDSLFC